MSGKARRAALLIGIVAILGAGAALAAPVPVLSIGDDESAVLAPLDEGDALTYSYRQSIYDAPVYEDFVRRGDEIDLLRVRSPDIRSIEYFHWDGDPTKGADGLWSQPAPRSEHTQLVLRIAPLGRQRIANERWAYDLLPRFGETVVTVRVQRLARVEALLRTLASALGRR